MVGTLVRLQLKLAQRSLGRSPGAVVSSVVAGLFGLVVVFSVAKFSFQLRTMDLEQRGLMAVALLSMVMVARLFALFLLGQEQALEPGRFALLPVSARRLQPGLFMASFLTVGGMISLLLVLASALIWSSNPVLMVSWLAFGVLGLALSSLINLVVAAKLTTLLHSRRFREVNSVVVGLAFALGGVLFQVLMRTLSIQNLGDLGRFRHGAEVLGWTPFGWPFAAMVDLSRGSWLVAATRLLLTVAAMAGLWWLWGRETAQALVSPIDPGGPSQQVKGHLPDRITPATPAGAIAARMLRYYRRDPRSLVQALVMAMLPLIALAPSYLNRDTEGHVNVLAGRGAVFFVMFAAVMMGIGASQQLGYDGSAVWMHVASGVSGRNDRWGRTIAFVLFSVPLLLVMSALLGFLGHDLGRLPNFLVAGFGALPVGTAVGLVVGAMYQIPMPPPGSSPFARNPGGGLEGAMYQLVGMVVAGLLVIPVGVVSYLAWGSFGWLLAGVAVAVVWGGGLLWAGITWGGRILDRSWPEVLARVNR